MVEEGVHKSTNAHFNVANGFWRMWEWTDGPTGLNWCPPSTSYVFDDLQIVEFFDPSEDNVARRRGRSVSSLKVPFTSFKDCNSTYML